MIGIFLIALAVLCFFVTFGLRKKSKKLFLIFSFALSLSLLIMGAFALEKNRTNIKNEREQLFFAVSYLYDQDTKKARTLCPKNTTTKYDYYVSRVIEGLSYELEGDDVNSRIFADIALNSKNKDIKTIAELIKEKPLTYDDDKTICVICGKLFDLLGLKEATSLEKAYQTEKSCQGEINRIYKALLNRNFDAALQSSSKLVRAGGKEEKLLLAEVIAEMTYFDRQINEDIITELKFSPKSADKEKQKLKRELSQLLAKNDQLDGDIFLEKNQENINYLNQKKKQNLKRADEIVMELQQISAKKALTFINSVGLPRKDFVRAKLYFSIGEKEKAFNIINSLLSPKKTIKEGKSVYGEASFLNYGKNSPKTQSEAELLKSYYFLFPPKTTLDEDMARSIVNELSPEPFLAIADFIEEKNESGELTGVSFKLSSDEATREEILSGRGKIFDNGRAVSYEAKKLSAPCPYEDLKLSLVLATDDLKLQREGRNAFESFLNPFKNSENVLATIKSQTTDINELIVDALESKKDVAIIISDSSSCFSRSNITKAINQGLRIHTIGLDEKKDWVLKNLSRLTGGEYFELKTKSDLRVILNKILRAESPDVLVSFRINEAKEPLIERTIEIKANGSTLRRDYCQKTSQTLKEEEK